jgi:transcriptional regulator GlxA family with amidase domain
VRRGLARGDAGGFRGPVADRVLVISGAREELVSSGASTPWHDLVLYLIARYAGAAAAQQTVRMVRGLAPYTIFEGRNDHGDADIQRAQDWMSKHFSVANPVEEMIKRSKLAERTDASVDEISWRVGYEDPAFFRRLFKRTTGLAPGAYRKRFRIPAFARP